MKKIFLSLLLSATFIVVITPIVKDAYYCYASTQPKESVYQKRDDLKTIQTTAKELETTEDIKDILKLSAKASIVFDPNSNSVLYGDNIDTKLPIASMTKMMTMLLVMEALERNEIDLYDDCLVSELSASQEGSGCLLDKNENYKVIDLLKSVAVASANDSCVALAEKVSGSVELFVSKMNSRAKELGMNNTNYKNVTGLDEEGSYSTAYDMCLIMKALSRFDLISKLSKDWTYNMKHSHGRETMLTNTNRLVRTYPQIYMAKTGHTDNAGYCMTCFVKDKKMDLIVCVMGLDDSATRFDEVAKLIGFGTTNFESVKVLDSQEAVVDLKLKGSNKKNIKLYSKEDEYMIIKKGEMLTPKKIVNVPEYLKAPIKEGEKVGEIKIEFNGVEKSFDLICKENIEEQTYLDIITEIINN